MFNGKMKALTFSYDDGTLQDKRLVELFHKYGMKATFNLNSELLGTPGELIRANGTRRVDHTKVNARDVKYIYEGHEVAVHTLTHPRLPAIEDEAEIIRQVEQDRLNLSELVGYEVVGMAYPCGGVNNDDRVAQIIRENTGVRYARTITSSYSFAPQENLYRFNPTVYHHGDWERLWEIGEQFLALQSDEPAVLYIWGHAFEFDIYPERWERFEEFLSMMSNRDDIFYGTNKEILLGAGSEA